MVPELFGWTHGETRLNTPTPDDLLWAAERRSSNTRRRKLQDERTQRGDYRNPGRELTPAYLKRKGA